MSGAIPCRLCGEPGHQRKTCRNLQSVAILMAEAMEILRRRQEAGGTVAHHILRAAEIAVAEDVMERRAAELAARG